MSTLNKIGIRYSPLSNRILIARFGKDPECALETRDGMNDFLQALVQYAFNGDMPKYGGTAEVEFGGGNEQFVLMLRRKAPVTQLSPTNTTLDEKERAKA